MNILGHPVRGYSVQTVVQWVGDNVRCLSEVRTSSLMPWWTGSSPRQALSVNGHVLRQPVGGGDDVRRQSDFRSDGD